MTDKPVVLYLDIDGVVNAFVGKNKLRKKSGLGYIKSGTAYVEGWRWPFRWSGELLYRLDELRLKGNKSLEVRLLSTWSSYSLGLEEVLDWAPDNVLEFTPNEYSDFKKLQIVEKEQELNHRPFVWIDDTATYLWTAEHDEKYQEPHLVLTPDTNLGMTNQDLVKVENFVKANS